MTLPTDILDASWSFVRAVALPNIEKKSLAGVCCGYCADFVLDKNGLENFDKWVADFLENLDSKTPDSSSVYHNSEAYKKLFRRLVGFYSLSDSHRYYLLDLVLVHIIFLLYLFQYQDTPGTLRFAVLFGQAQAKLQVKLSLKAELAL